MSSLQPVIALSVAAVGAISSGVASVLAATTDTTSDLIPWAQVGGTSVAVTTLAYVAKLVFDGKLVAFPVAELLRSGERREEQLLQVVAASHSREESLRTFLMDRAKGHDS